MDLDLDAPASLMRVTRFATTDDQETLVSRGTIRALVGQVLAMDAVAQDGLLLRAADANGGEEHDLDAIREIAARPEFTGAAGADDTAMRAQDPDRAFADDPASVPTGPSGTPADPLQRGERQ